jgi:hypothetical protein
MDLAFAREQVAHLSAAAPPAAPPRKDTDCHFFLLGACRNVRPPPPDGRQLRPSPLAIKYTPQCGFTVANTVETEPARPSWSRLTRRLLVNEPAPPFPPDCFPAPPASTAPSTASLARASRVVLESAQRTHPSKPPLYACPPPPREGRCPGWLGVSCPHTQPGTAPVWRATSCAVRAAPLTLQWVRRRSGASSGTARRRAATRRAGSGTAASAGTARRASTATPRCRSSCPR